MRWKPLSSASPDETWVKVLWIVLLPFALVLIGPLVAFLWLMERKRRLMGPREEWGRWFAWHPVTVRVGPSLFDRRAVWLEQVERRAAGLADPEYRLPVDDLSA